MKVNVSAKNFFPSERYIDAMLKMYRQGVLEKWCFYQCHRNSSLQEIFQALNVIRVYSPFYWLYIFFSTKSSPVLASIMYLTCTQPDTRTY